MRFVACKKQVPVWILILLLAQVALGQETARPEVLPRDAAELEIALGRIRVVPDRFRIVRRHDQFAWPTQGADQSAATVEPSKTCARSLQVTADAGRPSVKLSYSDPYEKWTLTVDNTVGAEWTRELVKNLPRINITYKQPPHQPIVVTIQRDQSSLVTLTADSLWHLTEQGHPEFKEHVLPALVRLNPTWDLRKALAAAKRLRGYGELGLMATAKHELAQTISQLDSSNRTTREEAKQKLRETGLAAHIPLEQLCRGPLTPQQRSTVEELLAELEPRSADNPTRLAYWLSGDPSWR